MVKFLFLPYCPGYDLSTMLNRTGDNGQLSRLPDLRRNGFNTSPLAVMSTVEFFFFFYHILVYHIDILSWKDLQSSKTGRSIWGNGYYFRLSGDGDFME